MKIKNICYGALLWVPCVVADTCDFEDFPVMDNMELVALMDDASHNNRPMMVRGYRSEDSREQVITYYQAEWEGRVDWSTYGIWDQITTLTDDCMMTVQVARDGVTESHGRLIISIIPSASSQGALGFDLVKPNDAIVVTDTLTNDGPKTGRVSLLSVESDVSSMKQFYRNEYHNDGWTLEREFEDAGNAVQVYRRGTETTNVLMRPSPSGSQVLLQHERID